MNKSKWFLFAFFGLILSVSAAYLIARMARPGGWQDQAWTVTSDGRVK